MGNRLSALRHNESLASILRSRCEIAAYDGVRIIDNAEAECRPLTTEEDRKLRLLAHCELPLLRRQWLDAAADEGQPVKDLFRLPAKWASPVRASYQDDLATLWLRGELGDGPDQISESAFESSLSNIPDGDDMQIRIDSPGGRFETAVAIHNMLSSRSGRVEARVDGIAASGASIICMAADEVVMPIGSWIMIHNSHGKMEGGVEDFREAADELERVNSSIFEYYKTRWLGTDAELRAALSTDSWFDAHQAVEAGLADKVGDSLQVAASLDLSTLDARHIPQVLQVAAKCGGARVAYNRRRAELKLQTM